MINGMAIGRVISVTICTASQKTQTFSFSLSLSTFRTMLFIAYAIVVMVSPYIHKVNKVI